MLDSAEVGPKLAILPPASLDPDINAYNETLTEVPKSFTAVPRSCRNSVKVVSSEPAAIMVGLAQKLTKRHPDKKVLRRCLKLVLVNS